LELIPTIVVSVRDESGEWHDAVMGTGDADGLAELLQELAAERGD
jgi:hypothetical protein